MQLLSTSSCRRLGGDRDFRGRDGHPVAIYYSADVVTGCDHVWRTLARHVLGVAFVSQPARRFLGVWLGGFLFERTGSYDVVWWLAILFGLLSAAINLPIVEKPVQRLASAPA